MSERRAPLESESVDLRVRIGSVEFPNPIFTASGTWGYALEYLDLVDPAELGGVVTKTITVEPRTGNPQPRVRELATGMLNSIGLENVGLAAFVKEKLPPLADRGVRSIVSLAGRDESEFATMIRELARHPGWVGVELNLSCPNVAKGGLDFGTNCDSIAQITESAKQALPPDKCLWVKLTPNDAPISALAQAAERAGADAISCINTLVGMMVDLEARAPVFPRGTAGYSGPGIKPVALAKVWQAANAVSIPIIGIGGIASVEDICEFFVVGAHAVQVGTMLFPRPDLAHILLGDLRAQLARLGAATPLDLRSSSVS